MQPRQWPRAARRIIWINPGGSCVPGGGKRYFPISQKENRSDRRNRQSRELEQNQRELRSSIEESKRLLDEANAMIHRHRGECESDVDSA